MLNGSDTLWWARINECTTPEQIRDAIVAIKEQQRDTIQRYMQEESELREKHKEDINKFGRAIRLMEEQLERVTKPKARKR